MPPIRLNGIFLERHDLLNKILQVSHSVLSDPFVGFDAFLQGRTYFYCGVIFLLVWSILLFLVDSEALLEVRQVSSLFIVLQVYKLSSFGL